MNNAGSGIGSMNSSFGVPNNNAQTPHRNDNGGGFALGNNKRQQQQQNNDDDGLFNTAGRTIYKAKRNH